MKHKNLPPSKDHRRTRTHTHTHSEWMCVSWRRAKYLPPPECARLSKGFLRVVEWRLSGLTPGISYRGHPRFQQQQSKGVKMYMLYNFQYLLCSFFYNFQLISHRIPSAYYTHFAMLMSGTLRSSRRSQRVFAKLPVTITDVGEDDYINASTSLAWANQHTLKLLFRDTRHQQFSSAVFGNNNRAFWQRDNIIEFSWTNCIYVYMYILDSPANFVLPYIRLMDVVNLQLNCVIRFENYLKKCHISSYLNIALDVRAKRIYTF